MRDLFDLKNKTSSVKIEVLAGLSTFLSLSYIFVVNPAILAEAGMDKSFVLFATIVTSAFATLAMGIWARHPFVLAPGMEMNAYVTFFVVGTLGLSWQEALGTVFYSGLIFIILTITHVRERIIEAIPQRMKSGLSLSVGAFLILVALQIVDILNYEGILFKGFGTIYNPLVLVFIVSLVLVLVLAWLNVRGSVLISIIVTSLFCHLVGIGVNENAPIPLSRAMFEGMFQIDLEVILKPASWSVILILFLVDFYGSIAKFLGLTMHTNIMENGKLPRMTQALSVDGIATLLGSLIGTTSVTTYVESGVGIGEGARTGLTAIVCGIMMLTCFLIAPLLAYVPLIATTGGLAYVGIKLCPSWTELRTYNRVDVFVLVIMLLTVIVTFAIDKAMLVGFVAYATAEWNTHRRLNPYLIVSSLLLALGVVLQAKAIYF